jgi:hypothetical protein
MTDTVIMKYTTSSGWMGPRLIARERNANGTMRMVKAAETPIAAKLAPRAKSIRVRSTLRTFSLIARVVKARKVPVTITEGVVTRSRRDFACSTSYMEGT